MLEIRVSYTGGKKCELTHPEGAKLFTDAPRDIGGDASAFSPTDLVASGLAACILTTMAIYAERHGIDLRGATATVEKHMSQPPEPRRIARLPVVITLPAGVPIDMRERLERAGDACPVKKTLHPDTDAPVTYRYG
ncbi:MAG: OsmC family protein [Planctomycetes bacterium]|nr:OsmC family protein [Planctomycetota bacterium]